MLEEEESAFDIQQLWTLFKANWKWFPLSMVVCVLIAGINLWFTPSTVTVTGKMEIIDKSKKGGGRQSATAFLRQVEERRWRTVCRIGNAQ